MAREPQIEKVNGLMNNAIRDAIRFDTGGPFHLLFLSDGLVHKYGAGRETTIETCCGLHNLRESYQWTDENFTCVVCIAWEASL